MIDIPGVDDAEKVLSDLGKEGSLDFVAQDDMDLSSGKPVYTKTICTGKDIKSAEAGTTQDESTKTKKYVVSLKFKSKGTKAFATATEEAAPSHKMIYIVYDGKVISNPGVTEAITNGEAQISGGFKTYDEAEELASYIRIGALPVELKAAQSQVVGAQLGLDAIQSSLLAGAIGFGLVVLFMIIFYRLPGLASSIALVFYLGLMLVALNVLDITLTLPGIAGIILNIGMAVDANVVIFTRIKEELATGASVKQSVKAGFHNALSAIIDGNVTTLIAALVLGIFGTGTIKGFAITLAIGIVLSVFTALVISQMVLNALVTLGVTDVKYFGKAKEPGKVNFVKGGKYCIIASVLVIVIGFCFMPIFAKTKGSALNLSIDFAGGTSITAEFDKAYSLSEAEKDIVPVIAEAAGISEADISVQTVSGTNEIVFKTTELTTQGDDSQLTKVTAALSEKLGATVTNSDNISGSASSDMTRDAFLSVALAAVLMLIYIVIRFKDVKFGVSAVLALCHDVAMVFVLYILLRLSVGNTCIACMLTIFGYSINATIIVFDRIRENIANAGTKKDYKHIVNLSINQTITRNIYTSLTTFVTIFVLYVMGVAAIKEFAFTLMAGVVIGAYSSICVTGPLWYYFKTGFGKKKDAANGKNSKKAVEKKKTAKAQ